MKTQIFFLIMSLLCGSYFVEYMRIPNNGFIWFAVCTVIYFLFAKQKKSQNRFEKYGFFIFSLIFSIFLVLGYHIRTNFDLYEGLKDVNYRTAYSVNDIFALFFLTVVWLLIFKAIFYYTKKISSNISLTQNIGISNCKHWVIGAFCLFAAWIPYLLIYYPGFIFGDSLASIFQALGFWGLSNHHPLLYTFFIKACLNIGMSLKDINFGCAIYTVLQMLYISFILSYLVCWIRNKGISRKICIGLMAFFAFVPFIPLNSIAMWKDPIFSASLALWSILLFDFVLSKGTVVHQKHGFIPLYVIALLLLCFSRNNGFYIVLFSIFAFVFIILINHKKQLLHHTKKLLLITVAVAIFVSIITGPVYTHFNLQGEPVESLGIFLNQMARVAATDGDMNSEDAAFMDSLLPLENYPSTYRPCVVDRLKWDENFNQEYLNSHLSSFIKTYFSLFIKNPVCYLDAWELNTFGYWAVNIWELNFDSGNISKGNLNELDKYPEWGIRQTNLLDNKYIDFTQIFRIDNSILSLAIINWLVFFITLLMIITKKTQWGIAIAPSLGLIITLIIATPYAYWQRYGLAEYYLLPFYILLTIFVLKYNHSES